MAGKRSAAQIAAQKKAAAASAKARKSKASSKIAPMTSHDAPGLGNQPLKPSEQHGSGTGLTSAYRYLPENIRKRRPKKRTGLHPARKS